jgi:hypothetical protein
VVYKDDVKMSKLPASCLVASLVGRGEAKSRLRTRQKTIKTAGHDISTSPKNLRSKDSRSQRGLHTFCWLARLQENGIKQTASGREIYGLYGKSARLELSSTPLTVSHFHILALSFVRAVIIHVRFQRASSNSSCPLHPSMDDPTADCSWRR